MLRRTERTRRSLAMAMAAVVLGLSFGLAGCGSSAPKNKDGDGTAVAFPLDKRKTFPDLTGKTLDGTVLSTSSFKGKVMVVNLWGSWCGPCQAEAPYLERAAESFKNENVQFVGLNVRDDVPQARAFVKDKQISYPNLVDGDDDTLLPKLVGITSLGNVPSTVIVDRNGKIAWRALRAVDYTELAAALDTVVTQK